MLVLLTIASRVMSVCQFDKKHMVSKVMLSKLKAEGWLFTHSAGIYATLSRDDRLKAFTARIEKMQLKTLDFASTMDFNDTIEIVAMQDEFDAPAVYSSHLKV